jgi:glycosyltransferase involved in cell wall biosynthesis
MQGNLKVSIITVCYNAEQYIEAAVQSVLSQTYPLIEYIIVDGASTDATMVIVNKHKDKIAKIISEKDNGIYDAMNKAVRNCSGDLVYFLNADDRLYSPKTVETVIDAFEQDDAEILYGKVFVLNIPKELEGNFEKGFKCNNVFKNKRQLLAQGMTQQSFFSKKHLFDRVGGFDTQFKLNADLDWLLRVYNSGAKIKFTDNYLAHFRYQGRSYQMRHETVLDRIKIVYRNCSLADFLFYVMSRFFTVLQTM